MIEAVIKLLFYGIAGYLSYFFKTWIRKKWNLIYLGITLFYFLPLFQLVGFNPIISIILLLLIIPLAILLGSVVTSVRFTFVAVSSGSHIKSLAMKYPEFAELEQKHRSLLLASRIILGVTAAAVFFGFAMLQLIGASLALLVMMVVYKLALGRKEAELGEEYKKIVVLVELNRAFTEVQYDSKKCFSREEISELHLFKSFNVIKGNDLLEARRGKRQFRYCDVKLASVYTTRGLDGLEKTETVLIFEGSAFHFILNEPSPVRLVAATENFANLQEADSILQKLTGRAGENSVEFEMDAFNRMFDVYCADQTAARVLLTPQMLEGIYRVGTLTKHGLAMLFEGNNLYMFLATPETDSFEIAISGQQTLKSQHEAIGVHVSLIASMIDAMYFKGGE